jgi:hypothetical protein
VSLLIVFEMSFNESLRRNPRVDEVQNFYTQISEPPASLIWNLDIELTTNLVIDFVRGGAFDLPINEESSIDWSGHAVCRHYGAPVNTK